MGGRRTALLLRLGLYTPPSSRTASSGRFVGGRPQTPARLGVANPPGPISVSDPTRFTNVYDPPPSDISGYRFSTCMQASPDPAHGARVQNVARLEKNRRKNYSFSASTGSQRGSTLASAILPQSSVWPAPIQRCGGRLDRRRGLSCRWRLSCGGWGPQGCGPWSIVLPAELLEGLALVGGHPGDGVVGNLPLGRPLRHLPSAHLGRAGRAAASAPGSGTVYTRPPTVLPVLLAARAP